MLICNRLQKQYSTFICPLYCSAYKKPKDKLQAVETLALLCIAM